MEPAVQQKFEALLARREAGEPVAYLTGEREFWSLPLAVNSYTLIPRPETETLIEWALDLPLPADAQVMDLGTGSGAIALALASERPRWQVVAIDASEEALTVARSNASTCNLQRVQMLQSDWFEGVTGSQFNLLVSNPPYVDSADVHLQQGDVRFEPQSALVSADNGLADIAHIIDKAPKHLLAAGWLLLEHGFAQGAAVRQLLASRGFTEVTTRSDLAGLERISGGRWHAER